MTPEFVPDRTAIVTGGARRIGAEIAIALADDGWDVLIHYRQSEEEARALAARLPRARTVQADLAEPDGAGRVIAALDGMAPPALLVNSASSFVYDSFDDFSIEAWEMHMAANARGPALLARAFAAAVPAGTGGLIVNMLDAKLSQPNPDFFTYTISKMAFAGVNELLARRLAGSHIRVNAIAPSVTLVSGPQSRENFDKVHGLNPLGRGVEVGEIVAALRFLVAVPTITGQTITLDGGQRFLGLPRDVQFMEL
ncbi:MULTISPECIES: SDR family oxidoreductase [unclassified Sphingomonas]|uniref:SDR family oxidoreductase n=1 Tax=unclassified Sphingomonas TaxID=196159 RepID=UPI0007008D82|nr:MULTISPECIES: SDR family oxidoreductase [unclassified Sphingomonas]KQX20154.1 short-chain dehydrogenase [Sphingomonas sp. Root1294]KQY67404.1 short-chain dehydrogenase [Sphingomonas sp. Root50]KRB90782.1 short-chain dehydrogenase [Sphingomonas sp. Root720]